LAIRTLLKCVVAFPLQPTLATLSGRNANYSPNYDKIQNTLFLASILLNILYLKDNEYVASSKERVRGLKKHEGSLLKLTQYSDFSDVERDVECKATGKKLA
jgi:hypothetical protein